MKKFIWLIVIAIIIWVAWYFNKDLFAKKGTNTGVDKSGTSTKTTTKTTLSNIQNMPIKYGDKSKRVQEMQIGLNTRYGEKLAEDGIYGNMTKQALLDNNFPIDVDFYSFLKIIGTDYAKDALKNIVDNV